MVTTTFSLAVDTLKRDIHLVFTFSQCNLTCHLIVCGKLKSTSQPYNKPHIAQDCGPQNIFDWPFKVPY